MIRPLAPAFALALLLPLPLLGQKPAGFVVRLGSDTIAMERYTRTATRLEGDVVNRVPRTRVTHYVADLGPDGRVIRFEFASRPVAAAPGGPPTIHAVEILDRDTAIVTLTVNDSSQTMRVPTARVAVPMLNGSYAVYEQAAMQFRRANTDSMPFDWVAAGAGQVYESWVARAGRDSVAIGFFGAPIYARAEKNGRLLALDGRATTVKVRVDRVPAPDIQRTARDFAALDASGHAVGQLSPRDTVRATVEQAHLVVDYGRPMKRGRAIFGGIVPWGQVWRTGANAATQFSTDADLVMGGKTIPAGTYSLWTVPSANGATLIINSQYGQWGTDYDGSKDFARLELKTESVAQPVEQFTIGIEPTGDGAALLLTWDSTRYVMPFTTK